jgi:hypothetical protein
LVSNLYYTIDIWHFQRLIHLPAMTSRVISSTDFRAVNGVDAPDAETSTAGDTNGWV